MKSDIEQNNDHIDIDIYAIISESEMNLIVSECQMKNVNKNQIDQIAALLGVKRASQGETKSDLRQVLIDWCSDEMQSLNRDQVLDKLIGTFCHANVGLPSISKEISQFRSAKAHTSGLGKFRSSFRKLTNSVRRKKK